MKLIYVLFVVAIMVFVNKGSAMPDSMEDNSDASDSQQDLRSLVMMRRGKEDFFLISFDRISSIG